MGDIGDVGDRGMEGERERARQRQNKLTRRTRKGQVKVAFAAGTGGPLYIILYIISYYIKYKVVSADALPRLWHFAPCRNEITAKPIILYVM